MMLLLIVALLAPSLCSAQLSSCIPPSITVGPPQFVPTIAAANIPLPCQASGTNPKYRWEFNGTAIQCPSPGFTCVNGVPTNITNVQASNEGFYRCFVIGTCGSTMSTLSQLQLQALGAPSTLVSTPPYGVNTPFSLPCGAQSTPSIADRAMRSPSSPYGGIPAITWYTVTNVNDLNTQQVQISNRIQIDSVTGDLYFATPLLSDMQRDGSNILYKCGTRLSYGETYGGFSQPVLSGSESSIPAAFFFKSIVPPQGLEGQSVEMQCFFSGRPTPSMQASSWTRSGGVSLPQGRTSYSNYFTKLIIANVQPEDAGDYYCAPSGFPNLAQTLHLVVDAVPVFNSVTDEPHDIKATEGDTVIVKCNAYAKPAATVQWYKDTTAFDANSLPPKFALNNYRNELTITNVCKGSASCGGGVDLMALQCDATNIHGKAFAQGSLDVLFPTIINSTAMEELVPNSALVIFPCEAYTDPTTNLTRTWYYKDNTIAQNDLIYVDAAGALHIDMRNDSDGGYARCGVYRCEATNGYSVYNIYSNLICDPLVAAAAASLWWISLIVVGFLLILLIFLIGFFFFFCYYSSNRGDTHRATSLPFATFGLNDDRIILTITNDCNAMSLPNKFSSTDAGTMPTTSNFCKGSASCGAGNDLMAPQYETINSHHTHGAFEAGSEACTATCSETGTTEKTTTGSEVGTTEKATAGSETGTIELGDSIQPVLPGALAATVIAIGSPTAP